MQKADGEEILALGHEMIRVTFGLDQDAYVEALLARANGEARTGPLFRAESTLREAWDLATKRALTAEATEAAFRLAVLLHDSGRLDEAAQVVATAEELAGRVERVFPSRLIAHELTLLRGGNGERAVERYEAAIDALPDPHVRIWPRHIAASFLSRARREAAARPVALLEAAERDSQAARCPRCMVTLQVAAAETLARLGRQDEAEEQLARAEALPALDAINRFLRLYARALVTAGRDAPRGAEMLGDVCAEGERLGRRIDVLWAKLDLARLVAPHDRGRAAGLLRDVAGVADALGATVPRLVAEQELRRLGVRTWRRGAGAVEDSLTARERQIAELVANGASNPEIAQEPFLSRKTVERHVSNVLAKLGARNRVELVALMARETEGSPR